MYGKIPKEVDDKNWDAYLIDGTNVLKNKLGAVTREELSEKESEIVFNKMLSLHLQNPKCLMNTESLLNIHAYLFEDIYYFAGQIRNCSLSKDFHIFIDPLSIKEVLKMTFEEYEEKINNVNSITEYAHVLARFYYALICAHPFREGNGRAIREFVREIVLEKNKVLPFQLQLDYSKMNKESLLLGTAQRYLYPSNIEMEFMKALVPLENIKEQNNKK